MGREMGKMKKKMKQERQLKNTVDRIETVKEYSRFNKNKREREKYIYKYMKK